MRPTKSGTPLKAQPANLASSHPNGFRRLHLAQVLRQTLPTLFATILALHTGAWSQTVPKGPISLVAEVARGALAVERPGDISLFVGTFQPVRVDWRQLRRWNIVESAQQPGTGLSNRQRSMWERNRKYIAPVLFVIFIQSLLIVALLWQRARKLKAEAVLRESEERFRLVANTAPVLIWMSGDDKLCTYVNKPWLEFTGRSLEEELEKGWADGIHPEDGTRCLETYNESFDQREPFRMEYRLRRYDGDYRWVLDIGIPRFNPDGSFAGYIGSAIDVTERKQAEAALSSVSRKLIEAQEQERVRIARELHDDINQRIALLSVTLEGIKKQLPESAVEVAGSIQALARDTMEIGNDIQVISHRLHSSHLEYVGIAGAARSFCRELAKQQNVTINFSESGVPRTVPHDIALCLYRVLQEALHNAVKHSGEQRYTVELRGNSDEIRLVVRDSGAGFDTESATSGQGLGLTSMRERVNLVNGAISISSSLRTGTEVSVRIPTNASVVANPIGMSA